MLLKNIIYLRTAKFQIAVDLRDLYITDDIINTFFFLYILELYIFFFANLYNIRILSANFQSICTRQMIIYTLADIRAYGCVFFFSFLIEFVLIENYQNNFEGLKLISHDF